MFLIGVFIYQSSAHAALNDILVAREGGDGSGVATITSINLTTGSGGDDGYARGLDQSGSVAVVAGVNMRKAKSGQTVFRVAP